MAHFPSTLRHLTLAAGLALGLGGGLAVTAPAEAMPVPAASVNTALAAPAASEQPMLQDVQYYRPYHRHWHRPHWHHHRHWRRW